MADFLDRMRASVLSRMAHGEPANAILREVCAAFEDHLPGTIVGVTILDRAAQVFEQAVFPSLAIDYAKGLEGAKVADKPGSCALAVYNGRTVVCEDVASDTRFGEGWKNLSLKHGLRALVSIPAMHSEGLALGTLVVAFTPDAPLDADQRKLSEDVAALCALVLTYRRNQMAQALLVGELQHRMRNLLGTVGAVVYSTLKSHPQPEVFRATLDGRLAALAKAHSLALSATETDLRQLLMETLAPYTIDHPVSIDGPRLLLSQDAAVAFSLAAHELATNAAKYGFLSKEGGAVRIGWKFDGDTDENRFVMTWLESGGPTVAEPSRQGFGQKTLRHSLAATFDATVALDHAPSGLRCTISAPHSPRLGRVSAPISTDAASTCH